MASIVKKIIRGRPYFYARVCRRVDGKPKIVSQTYLGSADKILAAVQAAKAAARPLEASVRQFGAPAALLALAHRLHLAEHIDRHAPKRGSGPSVGTYLLVAALNRCLAPCSKASLARWFAGTVLPRLLRLQPRQLSSQRFWEHMDRVPLDAIPAIERDFVTAMVREFDLDLRQLLFDATNFFTFIDTFNERSQLAQRGHSKEGRKSLRIVGVALLVTADFRLPLLHRTYPGNRPDPPMFGSLAADLARRCREIADGTRRVTLVFDKGNNSRENLERVRQGPFRFIGSLVPTQHPDLLATPPDQLPSLAEAGLPGVRARRLRRVVFGVERTVLVTWNAALAECAVPHAAARDREAPPAPAGAAGPPAALAPRQDARRSQADRGGHAEEGSTAGCARGTCGSCSVSRSARRRACPRCATASSGAPGRSCSGRCWARR